MSSGDGSYVRTPAPRYTTSALTALNAWEPTTSTVSGTTSKRTRAPLVKRREKASEAMRTTGTFVDKRRHHNDQAVGPKTVLGKLSQVHGGNRVALAIASHRYGNVGGKVRLFTL